MRVQIICPSGDLLVEGGASVEAPISTVEFQVEPLRGDYWEMQVQLTDDSGIVLASQLLCAQSFGGVVWQVSPRAPQNGVLVVSAATLQTTLSAPAASSTLALTFIWTYKDMTGTVNRPLKFARAELWKAGSSPSNHSIVSMAYTDATGSVTFSVTNGAALACAVFADDGTSVKVTDGTTQDSIYYDWTGFSDYSSSTSKSYPIPATNSERGAYEAMESVRAGYIWLLQTTGWHRSVVDVNWPVETWPHSHGDSIDIPDIGQWSDSIWQRSVLLHEYGHCIQYESRGGSFPPSRGTDPDPHYIYSTSTEGFALLEGWAEFFECAVDNNPLAADPSYSLESVTFADHESYGNWDGAIVEGAVASVFWDMFDGASASDYPSWDSGQSGDAIVNGFTILWDIMLNDKPDSIGDIWFHWPQKTTDLQAIFYHARIQHDLGKPVTNATMSGSSGLAGWYRSNVTVMLDAIDPQGISSTHYRIDSGPWLNYTSRFNMSGDGVHTLSFYSVDKEGNVEDTRQSQVYIDISPPVTSHTTLGTTGKNGWFISSSVTFSLIPFDTGSGTVHTKYCYDGGPWLDYGGQFTVSGDGRHTVRFNSSDIAGNVEDTVS
ncbi:MAG: hypothetical protein ABR986_07920, partial [Methanomassiliicoccales archaeon]